MLSLGSRDLHYQEVRRDKMTQHRSNFKGPVRKRKESVSVPGSWINVFKWSNLLSLYFVFCFVLLKLRKKNYPVTSSWRDLVQTIIGHRQPSASIKMVVIHGCRMLVSFQKDFFLLFFLGGHVSFLITVFHRLVNARWHKQDGYADVDNLCFLMLVV